METLKCQADKVLPVTCDSVDVKSVALQPLSDEKEGITLNLCPKHILEASALPGYQLSEAEIVHL